MAEGPSEQFSRAVAAHRDGDHALATKLCDSILADSGNLPEVLNLKAVILAEVGQLVAARDVILSALGAAGRSMPDDVRSLLHVHAARILSELDLYAEASEHASRAAELSPCDSGCLYLNARLALLSGHPDLARKLLDQCLEQFPGFEEARMLQCQLAMEKGDPEGAATALEEIVGAHPGHARAWSGLADLGRHDVRSDAHDLSVAEALEAIHARGPQSEESSYDWATAALALARMHRLQGDSRSAFRLVREANRQLREQAGWDVESWEAGIEATLAEASKQDKGRQDKDIPQPLFIVGMPRSGSTLLEQMLAGNRRIHAGGERSALLYIELHLRASGVEGATTGLGIDDDLIAPMRALYRAGMFADGNTQWVCDKALRNFERLGLAFRLFARCKVIWIVRNPVDAILSAWFMDFQHGLSFSHSREHLARMYRGHWLLMQKWMECFPDSICRVGYRDLVSEPEATIRRLCDFLDVEFSAAMLRPESQSQAARTASILQVQRPVHTGSLGRWRDFESELAGEVEYLREHGIPVDEI